jgi:hypothetical protein
VLFVEIVLCVVGWWAGSSEEWFALIGFGASAARKCIEHSTSTYLSPQ